MLSLRDFIAPVTCSGVYRVSCEIAGIAKNIGFAHIRDLSDARLVVKLVGKFTGHFIVAKLTIRLKSGEDKGECSLLVDYEDIYDSMDCCYERSTRLFKPAIKIQLPADNQLNFYSGIVVDERRHLALSASKRLLPYLIWTRVEKEDSFDSYDRMFGAYLDEYRDSLYVDYRSIIDDLRQAVKTE
ncbi:hypothetical protein [Spongorhabdus nitratireducens]